MPVVAPRRDHHHQRRHENGKALATQCFLSLSLVPNACYSEYLSQRAHPIATRIPLIFQPTKKWFSNACQQNAQHIYPLPLPAVFDLIISGRKKTNRNSSTMPSTMTYQAPIVEDNNKSMSKSFFGRFTKADGETKPVKEKKVKVPKEKKIKAAKKEKSVPAGETNKTGLFGRTKKKPRAEYQAEIDELQGQLYQTTSKYEELKRWAKTAPVR
jgi:hypothetical protein